MSGRSPRSRILDPPRGDDTVPGVRTLRAGTPRTTLRRSGAARGGPFGVLPLAVLLVAVLVALMAALVPGGVARAEDGGEEPVGDLTTIPVPTPVEPELAENTYREYVTPAYLLVPGAVTADDVVLVDDLTGLPVPLAGKGTAADGASTRVHLPQLPPGTFTLEHPTGELRFTVLAFDGTLGPVATDTGGTPWTLYALAGALLVLATAARRRTAVLLPALGGAALLLGLSTLGSADRDGDLLKEWSACEGANAGAKDQLSCKVTALTARLAQGDYDDVRDAVSRSSDPACHEITHRSSYHIWRTTRDTEKAAKLLIPGCDDGLIHGISESMATFSTDEEFPRLLADFCSVSGETFARGACFHGGGHAAVWRTNGDLDASFALCERFPGDGLDYDVVSECKGSAVMEWSERWTRERRQGGSTLTPRLDEPMEICTNGPESELFRLGCYLGTNFRTGDAQAAARWCTENEDFRASCFEALGENLPYFETPMTTIPLTRERALNHLASCALAPDDATRSACVRSTVRVYSVMKLSHREGELLCAEVDTTDGAACRDGVVDAEERLASRGLTLG